MIRRPPRSTLFPLHDALPISLDTAEAVPGAELLVIDGMGHDLPRAVWPRIIDRISARSEEHTSELQSPCNLVCRLLLEKKKLTLCNCTAHDRVPTWRRIFVKP